MFAQRILLCIFTEFAFTSYVSVYDAYNYLGHIYKFISFFIMFNAIYTDNVRMPYREMRKARNELRVYSENLNSLVKKRTRDLEDINATVYIGDVAGHGVSAAMLTVFANQNIKPFKEAENSVEIVTPGYVLKRLYKAFNRTNFKDETYLVMLYGIYNIQSRCFTYASGGINVPPLIIKKSRDIVEMDVDGLAICKIRDIIMPFYEDRLVQLEPGDKILFYTDGLVEAESNGNRFNQEIPIDKSQL